MLTAILIVLILLIALGLLALAFVLLYAWVVLRPLAKTDGSVPVLGLQNPVEILRDQWGVPHIYANEETDAWFAQGFVHAQDRLWQMELNRRVAHGQLAALFGAEMLSVDKFSRTIGFSHSAAIELNNLDASTKQTLQQYADGVNACIAQMGQRLPAEFTLLRFQPSTWTPLDTLACAKVFAWGLSSNWESELLRNALVEKLGPERAADLEPMYPTNNPLTVPGHVGLQEVAGFLLSQYDQIRQWFGAGGHPNAGSNAWAVDGKHSATGKPLLAYDSHLGVQMPCPFYENHLEVANGLRVTGASLPGIPGIFVGHNAFLAWGSANAPVDTQDLYVEQAHGENPHLFLFAGEWQAAEIRAENIEVRGQEPTTHEVVVTRHGPLITDFLKPEEQNKLVSLRWAGNNTNGFVSALLKMNHAQNWPEFVAAAQNWHSPIQNIIYADVHGETACLTVGQIPQRTTGLGLIPAPGWTGTHEWNGWIPFDELPRLINPANGFVVTANNKTVGDDYPHFLTLEWADGFRARRIEDALKSKPRHTRRDFEVLQNDVLSLPAQQVVSYFSVLNPEDAWERTALRQLVEWNYRTDRDSVGATVYELCHIFLLQTMFADKLAGLSEAYFGTAGHKLTEFNSFAGRASTRLLELLDQPDAYWYASAARRRTREELLQEALSQATKTLIRTVGDNPRKWQWGRFHQVAFNHPLGKTRFGWLFSRGPYAVDGDGNTILQSAFPLQAPVSFVNVAVAYRQIIDLDDFDRSVTVINTGQSGQPGSPHYADQIEPWREGEYHPMAWSRAKVEEVAEHRLVLTPT